MRELIGHDSKLKPQNLMAVSIAVPEVFDSVLDMIFEASVVPTAFRNAVDFIPFIPFSAFAISVGGAAARQRLTVIWEHSQTAPSFLNLMMVFDCSLSNVIHPFLTFLPLRR